MTVGTCYRRPGGRGWDDAEARSASPVFSFRGLVVLVMLSTLGVTSGLGAGLSVASARLTTFDPIAVPPKPTSLLIADVGTLGSLAGRPEQGDTVTISFSRRLAVNSICSAWSGDASDQSESTGNAVTAQIQNNAASSGNDRLVVTVAASSCPTFRFGSVDLGSPGFASGNVSFSGSGSAASTVAWQVANRRLVVTLGAASAGGPDVCLVCPGSVTASYTRDAGITDTSGVGIIGTASRTEVHF